MSLRVILTPGIGKSCVSVNACSLLELNLTEVVRRGRSKGVGHADPSGGAPDSGQILAGLRHLQHSRSHASHRVGSSQRSCCLTSYELFVRQSGDLLYL